MTMKTITSITSMALVFSTLVQGRWLDPRSFQSEATCADGLSWMDNAQHKSPCTTAAYMIGACVGGDYTVHKLTGGNQYAAPDNTTNNPCFCSWAVYNLLSACTFCQGVQSSISSWATWHQNCAPSNVAFPAGFTPPDKTTVPFWSTQDPEQWTDARWNDVQAKALSDKSNPDVSFSGQTTSSKSSNVGAIAGGVVGGVAAIGIGIALAIFLFCRHKRNARGEGTSNTMVTPAQFDPTHGRNQSDMSAKTGGAYSQLLAGSSPSNGSNLRLPYSPPTMHTHNSSLHTLPYDGSLSYATTTPPPHVTTPPPGINRHEVITPFILQQNTSGSNESPSKKDFNGGGATTDSSAGRERMNPPAYSESPQPQGHGDFSSQVHESSSHGGGDTSIITTGGQRRNHEKAGSMDSGTSTTSAGYWTQANSGSLGGAAGVLSYMDSESLVGGGGGGAQSTPNPPYPGPGPSMVIQYRNEKSRRPTVADVSSGDDEQQQQQPPPS